MRFAPAILVALSASPALADAVTYTGTIADRDIVLELTEPADGGVAGRFAFIDSGESIPLHPRSHTDTSFVLDEEGRCTADLCTFDEDGIAQGVPTAAVWELTLDGTALTGTRTVTDTSEAQAIEAGELARRPFSGDPTPLTLYEGIYSAVFTRDGDFDDANAHYELALSHYRFDETDPRRVGEAELVSRIDPRSQFPFPHLTGFTDGASPDGVNAVLDRRHAALTVSALNCLSMGYVGFGAGPYSYGQRSLGDYDSEVVELSYASPLLVSWTEAGSLYCGGAHPYNHFNSYTYDVETGRPLDLSLMFTSWLARDYGAETPVDPETARTNPQDYFWYPDDSLIAFVKDRIPADILFDDMEMDEICFGEDALRDQLDIRFAPGPNAVFTLSGFPHVISVCNGDLVSVPLAELGDFLTPDAARYFPEVKE